MDIFILLRLIRTLY